MRIGIDLDDTISNSSEVFIKYARQYNSDNNIDYNINTNELDQSKAFGWSKSNQKDFLKKNLKKILNEAIPKENAREIINQLYNEGNYIFIITARRENDIQNIHEFTSNWLVANDIKFNELITNCIDKEEKCFINSIDVFIDDNYENCRKVYEKLKIPVLLFNTIYNCQINDKNIKRVFNWKEISVELKNLKENGKFLKNNHQKLKYIDVYNREDLPPIELGMRYIHFYGGKKNYRAYIAPENISRADFMEQYPEYIPEQNLPIYDNDGIVVRADPKYSCPGFYIISLKKTYRAFDLLDDITYIRFCFILKKLKEGMRSELNINYAHLLSNEKSDSFVNVHFWLVPVNGTTSPDLLDFNIKKYLESFEPRKEIKKIIFYNNKLKDYFERINLVEQDNKLKIKLLNDVE